MSTPFKRNKLANRGKPSEDAVAKYLTGWAAGSTEREFNRLVDAKAAGRTIKAAAADFEFFCITDMEERAHGLIEVKETEHEYRLARDKVPQLPRLRKRAKCGGTCVVLVHHSTLKKWRIASVPVLASTGDVGSWNLKTYPMFDSPGAALESLPDTFGE